MEYLEYFEVFWKYFPYAFYTYVVLTFVSKSLRNIKNFATAEYQANRNKFHRCYGPELCCHMLIEHDDHDVAIKQKPRKAVTRAYLRKQSQSQRGNSIEDMPGSVSVKRQVQASAIQTQTNVNQIAKMFESGSGSMAHRRINRTLPEIRTTMYRSTDAESSDATTTAPDEPANSQLYKHTKPNAVQISHLLQENIENSMNLLNQQTSTGERNERNGEPATLPTVVLQRRTRAVPNTLTYAGTSATPSTASPAASSPHSSPASNSPVQPSSPVLRTAPLNLKTSVEDIFAAIARNAEHNEEQFIYAGCNTLSPVTSIDDILSQRRLSRPLSAYSISDLLNEEAGMIANTNEHHPSKDIDVDVNMDMDMDMDMEKDRLRYVEALLISTLNNP